MKHILRKIEAVDGTDEEPPRETARGATSVAAAGRVVVLPERLNRNGGPERRALTPRR